MRWRFTHLLLFCAAFCFLPNFLPPRGDLFIICSAILHDYLHICPFWFSFSHSHILVKSSKCLISNSLSIALVYPDCSPATCGLSALRSDQVCMHLWVSEWQTDRQTDYSKWWLYKQPHVRTPLHCHSNCIYWVCDFKWEKDSWRKWVMFWFCDGGEDCLSGSDGASVPHQPTSI